MSDCLQCPNVLWFMGGITALLIIATMVVWGIKKANPHRNSEELEERIKGWWIIIGPFFIALMLCRGVSIVFLAFVSYLAFKEYISLIPTRRADRRVLLFAYLAIPIQYWWIHIDWFAMFIIFIPIYMFLFLPLSMLLIGETEGFLRAVGTLHWGLTTTVLSLSHMAFLLVLPKGEYAAVSGVSLVLYLVFLTEVNDISQYIWGKSFGKRKVVPKVSPNKTWAGLIGGVLSTTLLAYFLAPYFTPFNALSSLIVGAGIGTFGFFGDITISAIKRDIGIKDSGAIIPGHGGILDRVDSLTFTAPLFLHFTRYFYF